MARAILHQITLDPECERIALVGGVVRSLQPIFLPTLHRLLEELGLYQISVRDPSYVVAKVQLGMLEDEVGMRGAALYARDGGMNGRAAERSWVVPAWNAVRLDVRIAPNLLTPGNPSLASAGCNRETSGRRIVVADELLLQIRGDAVRAYLDAHFTDPQLIPLRSGEQHKDLASVHAILEAMETHSISRRSEPVIAIGGGVLLDIVGLACGLYRRGTPYVRVPTTLMAMIDAGLGAKTGVNYNGKKNRLGTYFPPATTLIDPSFLDTLPDRHLRNGLAEIIKLAIVRDASLFELVEQQGARLVSAVALQGPRGQEIIERAVKGMLEELEPNLWEHELDRAVDFGHSFSAEIEMRALPDLLHGEAVNIDVCLSCVIAWRRGMLPLKELQRVLAVSQALGLPLGHPVCTPDVLWRALLDTTKHRDGQQRLPLPTAIGKATFVNDVTAGELEAALSTLAGLFA